MPYMGQNKAHIVAVRGNTTAIFATLTEYLRTKTKNGGEASVKVWTYRRRYFPDVPTSPSTLFCKRRRLMVDRD
jgi:hypothetical protein